MSMYYCNVLILSVLTAIWLITNNFLSCALHRNERNRRGFCQVRSRLRSFLRVLAPHPGIRRCRGDTRGDGARGSTSGVVARDEEDVPSASELSFRIDILNTQEIALVILGTRGDPSGIRSTCLLRVYPVYDKPVYTTSCSATFPGPPSRTEEKWICRKNKIFDMYIFSSMWKISRFFLTNRSEIEGKIKFEEAPKYQLLYIEEMRSFFLDRNRLVTSYIPITRNWSFDTLRFAWLPSFRKTAIPRTRRKTYGSPEVRFCAVCSLFFLASSWMCCELRDRKNEHVAHISCMRSEDSPQFVRLCGERELYC